MWFLLWFQESGHELGSDMVHVQMLEVCELFQMTQILNPKNYWHFLLLAVCGPAMLCSRKFQNFLIALVNPHNSVYGFANDHSCW